MNTKAKQPLLLAQAPLWGMLVLIVLGLGLAATEKWRPDVTTRLWDRGYRCVGVVTRPLAALTRDSLLGARKMIHWRRLGPQMRHMDFQISRLELENQLLREQVARLERLSGLGQWAGPPELNFIPADVTGQLVNDQRVLLDLNRGHDDGLRPGDPVVARQGLVGVVRQTSAHSARVQSIFDPLCTVGVVSRSGRTRGSLQGGGAGQPLQFVPENEVQPITAGTVLLTSGLTSSIYPKGIVVGTIQGRDLNPYGIPYGKVSAAATPGQVEEVLLVIPAHRLTGAVADEPTTAGLGQYEIQMPQAPPEDQPTSPAFSMQIPDDTTMNTPGENQP